MYNLKRIPRLNLEELHTFVVVAQLRSFSAAAELLHKTTSAISYRIKMLEDSMGVALIVRTTRTISLTPSGEMLLEKASQMLKLQESIPEELNQIHDGVEPSFTLVINNLLYNSLAAAHLLAHLNQRFPHTAFKLEKAVYMGVWDSMQHNNSQMAFGAPGFHAISDDFQAEALGVIDWVLVSSLDHPITQHKNPVTIDTLSEYLVINIEDTSQRSQKRSPWRLSGQQEFIVPDMETKIDCHAVGLGIGFLPAPLAQEAVRDNLLATIPLAATYRTPSPLALVWRRRGAGKINQYLRNLVLGDDPLLQPFFRLLSAVDNGQERFESSDYGASSPNDALSNK